MMRSRSSRTKSWYRRIKSWYRRIKSRYRRIKCRAEKKLTSKLPCDGVTEKSY